MCRFLVYKGRERLLAEWLIRPENSLIKQSYHAREMREPLNGDGFGVGWYNPGDDPTPCLFTSLTPAWSNRNLRRLAVRLTSPCCFAHVRAATPGSLVSEQNCHPFRLGRFLWMHNGRVAGFDRIMRRLRHELREDLYRHVRGTTDSEHLFHLLLNELGAAREPVREALRERRAEVRSYKERYYDLLHDSHEPEPDEETFLDRMVEHLGEFSAPVLRDAMLATLSKVARWGREAGVDEASYYNLALTDGRTLIVSRYSDRAADEPPSLYYSGGLTVADERGDAGPAILVASEPLTDVHEGWHEVPPNHLLTLQSDWSVESLPIAFDA